MIKGIIHRGYCPFVLLLTLAAMLPAGPVQSQSNMDTPAPCVSDVNLIASGTSLRASAPAGYSMSSLPDYIRIKRMGQTPQAVQAIEFKYYVKGVVPHEWYGTWPAESLKAGAMAAKTYAWYWVNQGDRHPDCDLYDTSDDQTYADDTYSSTNQAVEDTWLTGMRITGQTDVFESQYWDGLAAVNTPTLALRSSASAGAAVTATLNNGDQLCVLSNGLTTANGYHWFFVKTGGVTEWTSYNTGWVPGESVIAVNMTGQPLITTLGDRLTQWGTYYWANQGKDYRWMLQYFYPGAEFFTTSQLDSGTFTVVALPDTQRYSALYPATFTAQTQWIRDNRASRNIVFVTHVGDIAEDNSYWTNANTSMSILDGQLPYGIAPGNNDGAPSNTSNFNTYFPYTRYTGQSWYGGHQGTNNDNSYQLFSAGGQNFIILHIEYGADNNVLAWADSVLKANSSRRAIVTSHYLINGDGSFGTDGTSIYNALKGNPNLFLMLCGHVSAEARRADTYNGNTVNTLLADYQNGSNGGDGWMRLLEFNPSSGTLSVRTYSPTLNRYDTDAASQFDLTYAASAPSAPALSSPTSGATVSGTSITFNWSASSGATDYALCIQNTSNYAVFFNQRVGNVTSYTVSGFPNNGTQYRWGVAACNSSSASGCSSATFQNFTSGTAVPATPTLLSPTAGATASGTSVTFTWSASSGATDYALCIQRTSDYAVFFNQRVGNVTSYTVPNFPNNGTQYRWGVAACNSASASGCSSANFQNFISGP